MNQYRTIVGPTTRGTAVISLFVVMFLFGDIPKHFGQSAPQDAERRTTQQNPLQVSVQLKGPQIRQPSGSSADDDRQKVLKARQARALKRLNQLVDDTSMIGDAAARSRLMARVADALWPYDEPRARSLFKDAFEEAIYVPTPDVEPNVKRVTCGLVRAEIARSLAVHDHTFATVLVVRSAKESGCDYGPRNRNTSEHPRSELLAEMAASMVNDDPAAAYRLGLDSLEQGITSRIDELLKKLLSKNRSLGEQFFSACIERISGKDVNALEILDVANFLFQNEISPDRKQRAEARVEERADLKEMFAKKLLEAALVATYRFVGKIEVQQQSKQKADQLITDPGIQQVWTHEADVEELAASYYSMMLKIREGVERYDRGRLPETQALLHRLGRFMYPVEGQHMMVFYDNGDTSESLVAEAEKTSDAQQKSDLYELASQLAQHQGDDKKALELAAKIDDEDTRKFLTDGVWLDRALKATNRQEFDEAYAFIEMMKRPEGRLRALIDLAQRIRATSFRGNIPLGDSRKQKAITLMDEARTILMTGSPGAQQARTMMELAQVYAQADSEVAFEVTAKAIDMVNSTPGPQVADKTRWQFEPIVTFHDPLSIFGTDSYLFETLAKIDYERSLRLASKFNDPALGVAAQLSAVRVSLPSR